MERWFAVTDPFQADMLSNSAPFPERRVSHRYHSHAYLRCVSEHVNARIASVQVRGQARSTNTATNKTYYERLHYTQLHW